MLKIFYCIVKRRIPRASHLIATVFMLLYLDGVLESHTYYLCRCLIDQFHVEKAPLQVKSYAMYNAYHKNSMLCDAI
jgi:hypothetical protein